MKSRRLMSIILALAMLCTMFGNLTAFAAQMHSYNVTMSVVDESGNSIEGVYFHFEGTDMPNNAVTSADGTSVNEVYDYVGTSSYQLQISNVPAKYITPDEVTVKPEYFSDSLTDNEYYTYNKGEGDYDVALTLTLKEDTETTFNLNVKASDEYASGSYNITYYNEDNQDGYTERDCSLGYDKSITAYAHSNVTIEFTNVGLYTTPDNVTFRANEIADFSRDDITVTSGDEDDSYVMTVTLSGGMVLPSGSSTYTAKVKAVDESGNAVDGATFTLSANGSTSEETATDGDAEASLTFGSYGNCTLTVTAPEGYVSPDPVEFYGGDMTTLTGDFSGTSTSSGDATYSCDITVVLHEDSDDEDDETTYTVKIGVDNTKGETIDGVKYTFGGDTEYAADGSTTMTIGMVEGTK